MQRTRKYSSSQLASLLPGLDAQANKYTRGKATLVVGSADYPGAACLAAKAAERMGAGYTEVACAPESVAQIRAASASLVVRSWSDLVAYSEIDPDERGVGVPQLPTGTGDASSAIAIQQQAILAARPARLAPRPRVLGPATTTEQAKHPCAFLVGSGFNPSDSLSETLTLTVLAAAAAPVVVDGGGLAALTTPEARLILRQRFVDGLPTVITPHLGEAARLATSLDLPTEDPAHLAKLLSLAYGVVAMVKGPDTFVSDGGAVYRMPEGTAVLAKAGTGDVLAGMTCALLAQGLKPVDACMLASHLHAQAGILAGEELTELCVVADDVIVKLPEAIRKLMKAAK